MKTLVFLIVLVSSSFLFGQNKSEYVKFSEPPVKRLSYTNINEHNYFVEYKTKKKGSLFLELVKEGKVVALTRISTESKVKDLAKLNLNHRPNIRLTPDGDYQLRLSLYESKTKDPKKLVSEVYVEDVRLTRLLYTKL